MVVRTAELKKLEQLYKTDENQIVLLYGTKVSGTRELLRQFLRDKEYFYTTIPDVSEPKQRDRIMSDISERFNLPKAMGNEGSLLEVFHMIRAQKEPRLVLVADDFQNDIKQDSAIYKELCKAKESGGFGSKVMIILVVNEICHLKNEPEKYIKDIDKKVDEQIELGQIPFLDIVRAFPDYSVKEAVRTYGILGGNSDYLNQWNRKKSVKENVINTMLNTRGPLYNAASEMLSSELRELSGYETILCSMARGNEKLNDIYNDTGYSRAKLIVYLKNLEALDAVKKVVSFDTGGWDNAKKGIYRIKNHYLDFYFRFIYPHISLLFSMDPERFYNRFIAPELEKYLESTFVEVCEEYLDILNLMGKMPITIQRKGTWVGKNGTIDVVGQDEVRNNIVAKANYDKSAFPYEAYENLLSNMEQARIKAKAVYLFSATEFDPKLVELSRKDSSVILVDMKEL